MRRAILMAILAASGGAVAAQGPVHRSDGTPATRAIGAPVPRTGGDRVDRVPQFVLAQAAAATPAEPPPPPGLDEPGGDAPITLEDAGTVREEKVLPREGGTPVEPERPAPIRSHEPLPEKARPSDDLAPAVSIRTEGDVAIEEYRRNGQIYMIVITPKDGVRYTYLDTDGDGRLEGDPNDGPVQPVYYTLYEWE